LLIQLPKCTHILGPVIATLIGAHVGDIIKYSLQQVTDDLDRGTARCAHARVRVHANPKTLKEIKNYTIVGNVHPKRRHDLLEALHGLLRPCILFKRTIE
jgi:thiamine biosynthesis protein ThiC